MVEQRSNSPISSRSAWVTIILLTGFFGSGIVLKQCTGDDKSPTPEPTPQIMPFGTDVVMVEETPTATPGFFEKLIDPATSTPADVTKSVDNCSDWCGDSNKVGTGDQVGDIKFNCIEAIQKIEENPTTKTKIITKLSFYRASNSTSNKLDRHELAKTIFQLDKNGKPKCYVLKWSSANGSGSNCPNAEGITLPECP